VFYPSDSLQMTNQSSKTFCQTDRQVIFINNKSCVDGAEVQFILIENTTGCQTTKLCPSYWETWGNMLHAILQSLPFSLLHS